MTDNPSSIPAGFHTVTPLLTVRNAAGAIEFYEKAFGATQLLRLTDPEGNIVHAEIRIGDSPIMIAEENPDWGNRSPQSLGGSPVAIHLYVADVDGFARQAVTAGAKIVIPIADQFYGDRAGRLTDPFGHIWIVATRKEDVSPEEMQHRADAFMAEADGD